MKTSGNDSFHYKTTHLSSRKILPVSLSARKYFDAQDFANCAVRCSAKDI